MAGTPPSKESLEEKRPIAPTAGPDRRLPYEPPRVVKKRAMTRITAGFSAGGMAAMSFVMMG
jgi:hypothetical protein